MLRCCLNVESAVQEGAPQQPSTTAANNNGADNNAEKSDGKLEHITLKRGKRSRPCALEISKELSGQTNSNPHHSLKNCMNKTN
jgi:hypothetical protein